MNGEALKVLDEFAALIESIFIDSKTRAVQIIPLTEGKAFPEEIENKLKVLGEKLWSFFLDPCTTFISVFKDRVYPKIYPNKPINYEDLQEDQLFGKQYSLIHSILDSV